VLEIDTLGEPELDDPLRLPATRSPGCLRPCSRFPGS
jgi:hypothetical protein